MVLEVLEEKANPVLNFPSSHQKTFYTLMKNDRKMTETHKGRVKGDVSVLKQTQTKPSSHFINLLSYAHSFWKAISGADQRKAISLKARVHSESQC